jgi:hypothetical protein
VTMNERREKEAETIEKKEPSSRGETKRGEIRGRRLTLRWNSLLCQEDTLYTQTWTYQVRRSGVIPKKASRRDGGEGRDLNLSQQVENVAAR